MKNIEICPACVQDAEGILEIYSYYIKNTAITFETCVPTVDEFCSRIENTLRKYPYLVAKVGGKIFGYAYAGTFYPRDAYRFCCEMSIYIEKNKRGEGIGSKLYFELENELKQKGIKNLYACIAYPREKSPYLDMQSVKFHTRHGYRECGHFTKCGYKFSKWFDMIWMEKIIGEHI